MVSRFFSLIACSVFLLLNACSSAIDTANAVGTNDVGEGGTQDIEVDFFEITVQEVPEVTVYTSIDGGRTSGCRYDPDSSTSAYIRCIVDIDELDMFNNSFTLVNSAPGDLCKYRGFRSYYYANANVDTPPDYVSYEINPTSDVVTPGSVRYYYGVAPNPTDRLPDVNGTRIRAKPDRMPIGAKADVLCLWDYSSRYDDGKNCCDGQYQAMAFNASDTGEVGELGESTDWGGDPVNCFKGPAIEDSLAKTESGFPLYFYTQVLGAGFQDTYTIESPNDKRDAQIYLANYFDPALHPVNASSIAGETKVPIAIRPPGGGGFPFYRYDCLDENAEIISRIDVQFREWNVKSEILTAAGNPDDRGAESSPFGAQCKNDFFDWEDLVPTAANVDACYGSSIEVFTSANWLAGNFIVDDW